MARPQKEGLEYFPHDTDASNDEKIEGLSSLYGNDGYAFFFRILERIYRTANGELDISNPVIRATVIDKCKLSEERFNAILQTAIDIELFDKQAFFERHVLTSNGIKRRTEIVRGKRMYNKERYEKSKLKDDFCQVSATETTPESAVSVGFHLRAKGKESKDTTTTTLNLKSSRRGNSFEDTGSGEKKLSDMVSVAETTPETPDPLARITAVYREKIGQVNPALLGELKALAGRFAPEWFEQAVQKAVLRGAPNLAYIKATLEGWEKDGGPGRKLPAPSGKSPEGPDKFFQGKYGHVVQR